MMPALATATSRAPCASRAALTMSRTSASRETSPGTETALEALGGEVGGQGFQPCGVDVRGDQAGAGAGQAQRGGAADAAGGAGDEAGLAGEGHGFVIGRAAAGLERRANGP